LVDGKVLKPGKVGVDLLVEEGNEMARAAILNSLSMLQERFEPDRSSSQSIGVR
jgi:hypothetical protein